MPKSLTPYILALVLSAGAQDLPATPWPTDWTDAARQAQRSVAELYAAALLASGRTDQGGTAPWPWTLRISGHLAHYPSHAAARDALEVALHRGNAVEVGMLGIPAAALEDPVAALHPRANLMRGAALIEQAHTRYRRDALRALGAYRHSSARQARALGAAIEALAQRLEASDSQAPVRRIAGRANAQALLGCVPSARREVAAVIVATAKRYGVEPAFALAIARRESAFNQAALSPKQARGVMQLIPATAKRYGVDAHDLHQNIDGGVRYLRDLLAMFEGDLRLVAAGYNAGEGAVRRFGHQVPPYRETQTYVPLVLQAREAFLQCQSL